MQAGILVCLLGLFVAGCQVPGLPAVAPTVLSEQGCGRATGYDNANKIVTVDGRTHVAWLDSVSGRFLVRIRTFDNQAGTWGETVTVGEAHDNHGGPALTVDGDGFLHIAYYPHHHPVRYRKSVRPNDATEWMDVEHVGVRASYPSLVCGTDGTLYLAVRESRRSDVWQCNLYRKRPGRGWSPAHTLLHARGKGYCQFGQHLAIDAKGLLHMSLWVYEDRDAGRLKTTIGYLRSVDGGESWERGDGVPVALPADSTNVQVIAHHRPEDGLVRGGAMALDAEGRPHIFYRSYRDWPGALVWATIGPDGAVTKRPVAIDRSGLDRRQIPKAASATVDSSGRLCLALLTLDAMHADPEHSWGASGHEVAWVTIPSGTAMPLTAADPGVARWLPSIERRTGHNVVNRPSVIYTDGGRGSGNTDTMQNRVVFVRR